MENGKANQKNNWLICEFGAFALLNGYKLRGQTKLFLYLIDAVLRLFCNMSIRLNERSMMKKKKMNNFFTSFPNAYSEIH